MKNYILNFKILAIVFTFSFLVFNFAAPAHADILNSAANTVNNALSACPPGILKCTQLIVPIPGVGGTVTNPAQYIISVYKFALAGGGLVAMLIIVYAAIRRVASAGNTSVIEDSNDQIKNAVWGLVLLLGAFLILNTINPQLVKLQAPFLQPAGCVKTADNPCTGLGDISNLKDQLAQAQAAYDKANAEFLKQPDANKYLGIKNDLLLGQNNPDAFNKAVQENKIDINTLTLEKQRVDQRITEYQAKLKVAQSNWENKTGNYDNRLLSWNGVFTSYDTVLQRYNSDVASYNAEITKLQTESKTLDVAITNAQQKPQTQ